MRRTPPQRRSKKITTTALTLLLLLSGAGGLIPAPETGGLDELLDPVGSAQATHGRYVDFSWESTSDPETIEFTISNAWRRDGNLPCVDITQNPPEHVPCSGADGAPVTGDIFEENQGGTQFNTGDNRVVGGGPFGNLLYRVTAYDKEENWVLGVALDPTEFPREDTTIEHTYSSTGTYEAYIDDCCRISATDPPWDHINNPGDSYRFETTVLVGSGQDSPTTNMVPIVACPPDTECRFQVPASDPNGDEIRFRLSTSAEAAGHSGFNQPGFGGHAPQPMKINETTGVVTWNTTGAEKASCTSCMTLYSAQAMVEDLDAQGNVKSNIPVDFLIHITDNAVNPNTRPTFEHPPTPACGSTTAVDPGRTIQFDVQATGEAGRSVSLQASGLPTGATLDPSNPTGNPVETTFTWTPSEQDLSSPTVMTFSATDDKGLQALCSITVARSGADLEVVDVNVRSVNGDPSVINQGDEVQVEAVVRNNGAGNIPAADLELTTAGGSHSQSVAFAPTETKRVSFWATVDDAGTQHITVEADPLDDIHEFDESNNEMSASVEVAPGVRIQTIDSVTFNRWGYLSAPYLFFPGENVNVTFDVHVADPPKLSKNDVNLRLDGEALDIVALQNVGATYFATATIPSDMSDMDRSTPVTYAGEQEAFNLRLTLDIPDPGLHDSQKVPVLYHGSKVAVTQPAYELHRQSRLGPDRYTAEGEMAVAFVSQGEPEPISESSRWRCQTQRNPIHQTCSGSWHVADVEYNLDGSMFSRSTDLYPSAFLPSNVGVGSFELGGSALSDLAGSTILYLEDAGLSLPESSSATFVEFLAEPQMGTSQPLIPHLRNGEVIAGDIYIATSMIDPRTDVTGLPPYHVSWHTVQLKAPGFKVESDCIEVPVTGDHPHRVSFAIQPEDPGQLPVQRTVEMQQRDGRRCDEGLAVNDPDRSMQVTVVSGTPNHEQVQTVLSERVDNVGDNGTRMLLYDIASTRKLQINTLIDVLSVVTDAKLMEKLKNKMDHLDELPAIKKLFKPGDGDEALKEIAGALYSFITHNKIKSPTLERWMMNIQSMGFDDLQRSCIDASWATIGLRAPATCTAFQTKINVLDEHVQDGTLWKPGQGEGKFDLKSPESAQNLTTELDRASFMLSLGDVNEGGYGVSGIEAPPRPGLTEARCQELWVCWHWNQDHFYTEADADPNTLARAFDSYRLVGDASLAVKAVGGAVGALTSGPIGAATVLKASSASDAVVGGAYFAWSATNSITDDPYKQMLDVVDWASPYHEESSDIVFGNVSAAGTSTHTYDVPEYANTVNVTLLTGSPLPTLQVRTDQGTTFVPTASNVTSGSMNTTWVEFPSSDVETLDVNVSGTGEDLRYTLRFSKQVNETYRELEIRTTTVHGTPAGNVTVEARNGTSTVPLESKGSVHRAFVRNGTVLNVTVSSERYLDVERTVNVTSNSTLVGVGIPLEGTVDAPPLDTNVSLSSNVTHRVSVENQGASSRTLQLVPRGPASNLIQVPSTFVVAGNSTHELPVEIQTTNSTLVGFHEGAIQLVSNGTVLETIDLRVSVAGPVLATDAPTFGGRVLNGTSHDAVFNVTNRGVEPMTNLTLDTRAPSWVQVTSNNTGSLDPGGWVEVRVTTDVPEAQPAGLHEGWIAIQGDKGHGFNLSVDHEVFRRIQLPHGFNESTPDLDGDGSPEELRLNHSSPNRLTVKVVGGSNETLGIDLGLAGALDSSQLALVDPTQAQFTVGEHNGTLLARWTQGPATLDRTLRLQDGRVHVGYHLQGGPAGKASILQGYSTAGSYDGEDVTPDVWNATSVPTLGTTASRNQTTAADSMEWQVPSGRDASVRFHIVPQEPLNVRTIREDASSLHGTTTELAGTVTATYRDRFVLDDGTASVIVKGAGSGTLSTADTVNVTAEIVDALPSVHLDASTVTVTGNVSSVPAASLPQDPVQAFTDEGSVRVGVTGEILSEGATVYELETANGTLPLYTLYRGVLPTFQIYDVVRLQGVLYHGSDGVGVLLDTHEVLPYHVGDIVLEDTRYELGDLSTFTQSGSILADNSTITLRNLTFAFDGNGDRFRVELRNGSRLVLDEVNLTQTDAHVTVDANDSFLDVTNSTFNNLEGLEVEEGKLNMTSSHVRNTTSVLVDSSRVEIHGSTFRGLETGLRLEGATPGNVTGSTFQDLSHAGLFLRNLTQAPTFRGNVIDNATRGVYVIDSTGVRFADNRFRGAGPSALLATGTNVTLSANTFWNVTGHGVLSVGTPFVDRQGDPLDAALNRSVAYDPSAPAGNGTADEAIWLHDDNTFRNTTYDVGLAWLASVNATNTEGNRTVGAKITATNRTGHLMTSVHVSPRGDTTLTTPGISMNLGGAPVHHGPYDIRYNATKGIHQVNRDIVRTRTVNVTAGWLWNISNLPAPAPVFAVGIDSTNSPVEAGEVLRVSATVHNVGAEDGASSVVLENITGAVVDAWNVTLAAGQSELGELTWTTSTSDVGQGTVLVRTVDGSASSNVEVVEPGGGSQPPSGPSPPSSDGGSWQPAPPSSPPPSEGSEDDQPEPQPELVVQDASLDATDALVGEPVTVTVLVENVGNASGNRTLAFTLGDGTKRSRTVAVEAGATGTVELQHTYREAGDYSVRVDGAQVGSVSVMSPQPNLEVTRVDLPVNSTAPAQSPEVCGVVENNGTAPGNLTLKVSLDGSEIASHVVHVEAGAVREACIPFNVTETGSYTVQLNGMGAGLLQVEPPMEDEDSAEGSATSPVYTPGAGTEGSDDDVTLPVPGPSSLLMMFSVLAAACLLRRRGARGGST